jgi:hypothetical protein
MLCSSLMVSNPMEKTMKTALATTFAVAMLAASSFAIAADNGNRSGADNNTVPRMNDSMDMKTDPDSTGSIKCDNSNANVNSGCDKPGHLKQEEHMEENQ